MILQNFSVMENQCNGCDNAHGSGHGKSGKGGGGNCVCPECGYSEAHKPGIPCKSIHCPDCKIQLVRNEISDLEISDPLGDSHKEGSAGLKRKVLFPCVIPEKCTACGSCIDICPTSTIVMRGGKAFVISDFCKNCRVCIKVCRFNAFKLA